jgi:hypothetical protein
MSSGMNYWGRGLRTLDGGSEKADTKFWRQGKGLGLSTTHVTEATGRVGVQMQCKQRAEPQPLDCMEL